MLRPPRIWISSATPKAGERVRVRAQVDHRMETGLRTDDGGKTILRNITNRFEATLAARHEWHDAQVVNMALSDLTEVVH